MGSSASTTLPGQAGSANSTVPGEPEHGAQLAFTLAELTADKSDDAIDNGARELCRHASFDTEQTNDILRRLAEEQERKRKEKQVQSPRKSCAVEVCIVWGSVSCKRTRSFYQRSAFGTQAILEAQAVTEPSANGPDAAAGEAAAGAGKQPEDVADMWKRLEANMYMFDLTGPQRHNTLLRGFRRH